MNEKPIPRKPEVLLPTIERPEHVWLAPAGYVTVSLAAAITGLSQPAIRGKFRDGKWIEGREFVRAPDGGVFISIEGFERWVCAGSK